MMDRLDPPCHRLRELKRRQLGEHGDPVNGIGKVFGKSVLKEVFRIA
jgi:hypothetical protein